MRRVLGVLMTVAGLAFVVMASQGQASAQGVDDPAQAEAGKAVFEMSCAGCHAADGSGVANRGRPLTGIASQGDRATHIMSVTDGKGGMPAFGPQLSAEQIEQAVSYVRLTFVEAPAAEEPAEEEAAAETTSSADTATADTELALTGVGTTGLAVVGVTMLAAGLQLTVWSKRRD